MDTFWHDLKDEYNKNRESSKKLIATFTEIVSQLFIQISKYVNVNALI